MPTLKVGMGKGESFVSMRKTLNWHAHLGVGMAPGRGHR